MVKHYYFFYYLKLIYSSLDRCARHDIIDRMEPTLFKGGVPNYGFYAIRARAESFEADMTRFLRDLVHIPGESCREEGHARRIADEMQKLGFDKVTIDPQGNVIGIVGNGEKVIAFDGHIDTVGIGEISNWKFDPYEGYETETEIGGRGTSDQLGGVVSAVYGAKIMKDLGLIPQGIPSWSPVRCRKRIATAFAGNTIQRGAL